MNKRCIIVDRDGTLIKHIPYLYDPDLVELKIGAIEALAYFKEKDYKLFLHTNQSGVERGYFAIEDAIACNDKLIKLLGLGDNIFNKICIAPNLREISIDYRKPSPLFANEIKEEYNLINNEIIYIGDSICDLQTAVNVGCDGIGIKSADNHLVDFVSRNPSSSLRLFENWIEIKKYFENIDIK